MLLWGISTALHTWVRARWQLYVLRIIIGCLEGRLTSQVAALWKQLLMSDSRLLPRHRFVPLAVLHPI